MDAKYTKGPWGVREAWNDDGYEVFPTRGGAPESVGEWCEVASVPETDVEGESAEANANLIAAAPELLEALEVGLAALVEARGWAGYPQCQMRATIAKALGEAK